MPPLKATQYHRSLTATMETSCSSELVLTVLLGTQTTPLAWVPPLQPGSRQSLWAR